MQREDQTPHHGVAEVTEALRLLTEVKYQAEYDLCGEQRDFHLPRINTAWLLISKAFPAAFITAMETAKRPDGTLIYGD